MNSPQRKILRKRTKELENISNKKDLHSFHSSLLKQLEVKTVIKENHERAVEEIRFNFTKSFSKCSNLFASVGADMLTVYDDNHFGDHVALVCQFKNTENVKAETKGGPLYCLSWVDAKKSEHEQGDALVAVAGEDMVVSIVSISESAVVQILRGGHAKAPITGLATNKKLSDIVVSLSEDEQKICMWSLKENRVVAEILNVGIGCKTMTLLEDGSLVCGFTTGAIAKRFTNFCSFVVEEGSGGNDGGEKKYPKKINSVDASKDSKCYSAVNFGFGQASAKSKGGDKSIGIDCIQSFEEDVEEEETIAASEDDNKNKKQKKTTDNNNNIINNKKKKDQHGDKINASQKRRRILVAKTADSEVSVVDFSNGFEKGTKIETTFRVENAKSNVPAPTSKTNGKRTVSFGLSHDGTFLACGNGTRDGIVYVYDLNVGDEKASGDGLGDAQKPSPALAAKLLPHERHSGTMLDVIRSCAIAKDCRHVLGTTDANDGTNRAGIVFRYEIIPEQPKEYEPPMKTGDDAVGEGEVTGAANAAAVDKENA
jgi:WD40 repeat protein